MKNLLMIIVLIFYAQVNFANATTSLASETQLTINKFSQSEKLKKLFEESYGYAAFPSVAEGGIALSGAFGEGEVFKGGVKVGRATLTQVSFGATLGGKTFDQVMFFVDERAFNEFTSGKFALSADASAVALDLSAQASSSTVGNTASTDNTNQHGDFVNGIAVYQYANGGFMLDLSIGGQKFSYESY
ncbi:lipid-binding SYLF domain-containing protein [Vibrio sp. YYF0003]|uniref:lipid-binding SYLF domain-containing protein n=1 Tax=Vibrio sp. YYF0003 TaxID=3116646 RepID=UPI002E9FD9F9|nr:lipid-binding SYLF domain-containing protein [Vibrio sp. YYF0003]